MGTLTASSMLIPSKLKPSALEFYTRSPLLLPRGRRPIQKKNYVSPVMRLFGPAIFEASKLKVLFLGADDKKQPPNLPRTYTLTHSDMTAKLTLAISQTINNSQLQGWSNKLYRDEVVAEWKKVKGNMSLHVHCHISGGHFLLDLCAKLRYYIFSKELPVVLNAFVHGDVDLFRAYPELEEALVWVYFHSNTPEFNKVECWGPLKEAVAPSMRIGVGAHKGENQSEEDNKNKSQESTKEEEEASLSLSTNSWNWEVPQPCKETCNCCFPPMSIIPWAHDHQSKGEAASGTNKQGSLQQ